MTRTTTSLSEPSPLASAWVASPAQRRLLAGTLALIFFLYVACFLGVVGANDGSHYALAQAMATRGTFRIDRGLAFATSDVAVGARTTEDGTPYLYSNKPPGTAVLAVPFYWLGAALDPLLERFPPPDARERNDLIRMRRILYPAARDEFGYPGTVDEFVAAYRRDWARQNAVNLLPALAGTACCALVYLLARQLGAGFAPAMIAMILTGLGTLQWRYSTVLFAHIFSALLLLVVLYLLLTGRAWSSIRQAFLWAMLVGFSGAVEYQALLTAPFVGIYWACGALGALDGRRFTKRLGAALLGFAIPLMLLAGYQWKLFGSPWTMAPTESLYFQEAESVGRMLTAGSLGSGLRSLLFGNPHAHQEGLRGMGLVSTSPFLAIALFGWFLVPKGRRGFALLVGLCILSHVVLMASVWSPMGGSTFDARYLLRIVPLAAAGFAMVLERCRRLRPAALRRTVYGVLTVLALVSVVNAIGAVGTFNRHDIFLPSPPSRVDLAGLLRRCAAAVGNDDSVLTTLVDLFRGFGYLLDACFANRANWPLFLVAAVLAAGIVGAVAWCGKPRRPRCSSL